MPLMKKPSGLIEIYMFKAEELLEKAENATTLDQSNTLIELADKYIELARTMTGLLLEEDVRAFVKVVDDSMHVLNTRIKEGVDALKFK